MYMIDTQVTSFASIRCLHLITITELNYFFVTVTTVVNERNNIVTCKY